MNQPNYSKEKPPVLYRGVIIKYELLKDFEFIGKDLTPPYPPKIDEQGRKTVDDGNEYGVYMTDNEVVARKAYAAVSINHGTPLNKTIMFGYDHKRTMVPAVGIVYKIDTNGLDAHVPWITSYLNGHYNNGMGGDEWIAETVPAENYSLDTVELGADILHESEMLDVTNIEVMKQELLMKLEQRKERLELFEKKIESMPSNDRFRLDSSKIEILKNIYRLNGIMDIDVTSFEPQSTSDYLKYLMAVTYSNDKENIDFNTLDYIQKLNNKLKDETSISDIVEEINKDMINNDENGENYSTASFDKKNNMYLNLLKQLDSKINSKEKTGYSREENENVFLESQEQILTDYSGKELGYRIIEEQFEKETGRRIITTNGELVNEDGEYKFSENSEGIGIELEKQRKEMVLYNSRTGKKEQYVYQKDNKGNETYYNITDGSLTFKISKNSRGTTIENFNEGHITDVFEYDEEGKALISMGDIESIDKNYVENFFDSQVPYFEAENREISNNKSVGNTQKLGKETTEEIEDIDLTNKTEKEMERQEKDLYETKENQGK